MTCGQIGLHIIGLNKITSKILAAPAFHADDAGSTKG
jgi:hypothetical protein